MRALRNRSDVVLVAKPVFPENVTEIFEAFKASIYSSILYSFGSDMKPVARR